MTTTKLTLTEIKARWQRVNPNPKATLEGSLIIGNPTSNVGICTLWNKRSEIASQLPVEDYFAIGQLYSIQGIRNLVTSLLIYPNIRFLIVVGADMSGSGKALGEWWGCLYF